MTNNQSIRYEMLLRVSKFGDDHQDVFPSTTLGGQTFAVVTEAARELGAQAVSKASASHEGRSTRAQSREALTRQLEAMVRSARMIARDTAGFDARYRMPRPRTDQALLTAGRVFIEATEPVKDRFIEFGMPVDFVASLKTLVDDFDTSLAALEVGRDGHTKARASIDAMLASGIEAVQKLDVIVTNHFQHDAVTMAVWKRDRRVEYARRVRRVTATRVPLVAVSAPTPTPTAAPPAPSPAPGTALVPSAIPRESAGTPGEVEVAS